MQSLRKLAQKALPLKARVSPIMLRPVNTAAIRGGLCQQITGSMARRNLFKS